MALFYSTSVSVRPPSALHNIIDATYDEAQTLRVMPSDEGKEGLSAVSQVRQRIESSFSELWRRFADRIYSRSWHGLWTNLLLKILDFNMERAGIIATA